MSAIDCQACGLCCISRYEQESFCDVEEDDIRRMGQRLAHANVLVHSIFDQAPSLFRGRNMPPGAIKTKWREQRAGPFKGVEVCACVFLRGSIMHRVSCRIYERRPRVCRVAMKPGSRSCHALRRLIQEAKW